MSSSSSSTFESSSSSEDSVQIITIKKGKKDSRKGKAKKVAKARKAKKSKKSKKDKKFQKRVLKALKASGSAPSEPAKPSGYEAVESSKQDDKWGQSWANWRPKQRQQAWCPKRQIQRSWGSWNKGGWPEKGPVEPASVAPASKGIQTRILTKLAAELFREAQEEAWSDVRRVLSAYEYAQGGCVELGVRLLGGYGESHPGCG